MILVSYFILVSGLGSFTDFLSILSTSHNGKISIGIPLSIAP